MNNAPTVNWARGYLRPYESLLSFVTRFAALNGRTVVQARMFLGILPPHQILGSSLEVIHAALVTHESLRYMISSFFPSAPLMTEVDLAGALTKVLRYCPHCADVGFHSSFHEISWIKKCPIHLCDLVDSPAGRGGLRIFDCRARELRAIMRDRCATWPRCDASPLIATGDLLNEFRAWAELASRTWKSKSRGLVWEARLPGQLPSNVTSELGQLLTICEPSRRVREILAMPDCKWRSRVMRFPAPIAAQLEHVRAQRFSIQSAFEGYKLFSKSGAELPFFSKQLRRMEHALRLHHHSVPSCRWELAGAGWHRCWVEVDFASHSGFDPCPFELAIQTLENGWGDTLMYRGTRGIRIQSDYIDAAAVACLRYGLLEPLPSSLDGWTPIAQGVRWIPGQPLTALFEAMASLELEATYHWLVSWLEEITDGSLPDQHRVPQERRLQLHHDADGLELKLWYVTR